MTENQRKPRLPSIFNTLALTLLSLQNEKIVVELRNNTEISGIVDEVDSNMNLILTDVKYISACGEIRNMELLSVNGSNIRYVHISKEINLNAQVQNYVSKTNRNASRNNPVKIMDRKKKRSHHFLDCSEDTNEVVLESYAKYHIEDINNNMDTNEVLEVDDNIDMEDDTNVK